MAIRIDSSPASQYHFAYKPIVWTVSSNDATVIRCIADVYINGVYTVTFEKSPDLGETDVFTFDFQNIAQDNLKAYVPNFTASIQEIYSDTNAANSYTVRFFEVLDNGTTFTTTWSENGTGTGYWSTTATYAPAYILNGTLRHEETQDLTNFQESGAYSGLSRLNKRTTNYVGVFTNKARRIKRGDFAVITGWESTAAALRGRVNQYNSIDINTTNILSNSSISSASHLWQNAVDTTILDADCVKFFMRIEDTSSGDSTGYSLWELVECDNDYVSLYWQNDFGGMDYYLFRDGQVKTIQGESQTFTKPLTTSYSTSDFGTTVLSKSSNIGISATSEVLNRTEADGLSTLFTHGVRAWIYKDSQFLPVVIADGGIDTINTSDGVYRANIDLVYSNKPIAQRF